MKVALYWKTLNEESKIVQCTLCPHYCTLKKDEVGKCNVRQNINGTLFSLVYGKPAAMNVDPIEKKPLFHFLPKSKTFSLGTFGCNFDCKNCQNFDIARGIPDDSLQFIAPEEIVRMAIDSDCQSIAYTYTEPTIFYEYMLDIAKIARKSGLKNILVTNGFINKAPLLELLPFIDAANIDLKGDKMHYVNICEGRLEPVLETMRIMHEQKIHVEITNLIIPTLNDSIKAINDVCKFILSLSTQIPLHFSAFYPMYKLTNIPSTPQETLVLAKEIAVKEGLKYVYLGNVPGFYEDTKCPNCKKIVIRRKGFLVEKNDLKKGNCVCGEKISGVWN